ncbi:serine protease inhibitor 42Dd-like [Bradysia coprophila]|uniref:serine protease inhibitor 42Dd-like n=1 Tax=Bradysia coprophila TaxID=38358 RepID=UPI00187D9C3E|nr:serine protease inhibitor 42Dd-like [Bradysia coprophila]
MQFLIVFVLIPIAITNIGISAQLSDQTSNTESEGFLEFSKAISRFAVDFYEKCSEERDGNIIVSPFSVANVLALLIQGAEGKTLKQLQNALHLQGDKETIANYFQEYFRTVRLGAETDENPSTALSLANRLYLQQGYQVKSTFKEVISKKLNFDIESLNFEDGESCARSINEFVATKTKNKITEMCKPDSFDATTRLVVVNAIHFKDDWKKKFDKAATYRDEFFVNATNSVPTEFMTKRDHFKFANLNDLDASAAEIRYQNSGLVFVIVLPNSRNGLSSLESKVTNLELKQITDHFYWREGVITIPKFKIELVLNNLGQILQKLGMTEIFTSNANLRSLLDPTEPIQLSEAIHKAIIEVNEDGVEAAAATGLGMVMSSAVDTVDLPFKADHPFLYYIMDPRTNTIIFSGRYVDPSLEAPSGEQKRIKNDEL